MKTKVIKLPNGRYCTLRSYVQSWRTLKQSPNETHVSGFYDFRESPALILAEISASVHDRINRHDRAYGIGRKWDCNYQIQLWRDSRRLSDIANRIRVYQFDTREAQSRFSGRLSSYND